MSFIQQFTFFYVAFIHTRIGVSKPKNDAIIKKVAAENKDAMTKYVSAAPLRCLHTQPPPPFPSQQHPYTLDNEGKKGSTTTLATKTRWNTQSRYWCCVLWCICICAWFFGGGTHTEEDAEKTDAMMTMVLVAHLPVMAVWDTSVEERGMTTVIYTAIVVIDTSILVVKIPTAGFTFTN